MQGWKAFAWLAGVAAGLAAGFPVTAEETAAEERFTVEQVIHPAISRLPPPDFFGDVVALPMAITGRNDDAQRHVLQGMSLINAGWDFEAYRHFCEAARADRDCIMAYWGIGLSLAAPNNEFVAQRNAAVQRMLDLIEAGAGTAMERGYAMALASLFGVGAEASSEAFTRLFAAYPNNLQARLLSIYMRRGGYDEFGEPGPGQEAAMKEMRECLNEHPDNIAVLTFWAMLHAEYPDATGRLPEDVLPFVRKIARIAPDFPPHQHLLGHFEWRCGNHRLAQEAFERASALFKAHMEKHKLTFHDCDWWVRTRLYLTMALVSRGRFEEAMGVARGLAALEVEEKRLRSAGANLVLWEARTLPARLYASRGAKGDFDRAIGSLPEKDNPQLFLGKTLSVFFLEGLRQYFGARRELVGGDRKLAAEYREALSATGEALLGRQTLASRRSSISEYLRALRALEVLSAEMRGLVALSGGESERGSAFNWFKSAISKQLRPSMLMPPMILYPMELRLGEYYLRSGDGQSAANSYWDGLMRCPNDLASLVGYGKALEKLGRKEDAARIARQIEMVRDP